MLPAHHKVSFYNTGKNENGLCLFAHELRRRIAGVKSVESGFRVPIDFGGASRPAGAGQRAQCPERKDNTGQ